MPLVPELGVIFGNWPTESGHGGSENLELLEFAPDPVDGAMHLASQAFSRRRIQL
jgi:hypothetical protein